MPTTLVAMKGAAPSIEGFAAGVKLITTGPPFTLLKLLGLDLGWVPGFPNSVANAINSTTYLDIGLKGLVSTLIDRLEGNVDLPLGNIIANPLQGVVTLTVVISIVLIVEGAIRLFRAFQGDTPHRGIEGVIGVIDILLGLWLWSNIPISGVAIGFFVGFELLMAGIIWIIGGWMGRSATRAATAAA